MKKVFRLLDELQQYYKGYDLKLNYFSSGSYFISSKINNEIVIAGNVHSISLKKQLKEKLKELKNS